ncbi:GNAT family N-acetyltransferase [Cumulibacter soli]|uniref:GNAT family N-acetyltransferase n=1 Tax=Cumulibacter soli TaxID=2546344 RepID=UPI001068B967|nr:GNAT family N-acetyltransferase [Cumulibacter soli]
MDKARVRVRPVSERDGERWRELFAAYRAFYRQPADEQVVQRVWQWVHDDSHETNSLVATADEHVVGIANYRRYARPLAGGAGLWLDDLFTDPSVRGLGIGRALITRLQGIAHDEGLGLVRWITAADNVTAQRLYDTLAERTTWVTYDAPPRDQSSRSS